MKLTITNDGKFVYKQIGPVNRVNILGPLTCEDGQYKVLSAGKEYKILTNRPTRINNLHIIIVYIKTLIKTNSYTVFTCTYNNYSLIQHSARDLLKVVLNEMRDFELHILTGIEFQIVGPWYIIEFWDKVVLILRKLKHH